MKRPSPIFYRQIDRPFKQCRKKLGIICVICDKALDGTNYDHWTWLKCERIINNNTINLICHLEKNNACVASVKEPVINNKKKGLAESGPATVQSIVLSPNTRVTSSIAVTMKK